MGGKARSQSSAGKGPGKQATGKVPAAGKTAAGKVTGKQKAAAKKAAATKPAATKKPATKKPAVTRPATKKPAATRPAASKKKPAATKKAATPATPKARAPAKTRASANARKQAKPSRAAGPAPLATASPEVAEAHMTQLLALLRQTWGEAVCELDHADAYQLLVATLLSAQSTDKRINQVTPALFARYPDARALAGADPAELEDLIRSTGFFRMKAKHLLAMAQAVVTRHGGEIPRTMRELVALPGVARKTANVVLGNAFGLSSGIVVDTHVQRVTQRLGLTAETQPEKIERDLMKLVPRVRWIDFGNQIIWHGRRICHARAPACEQCPLAPLCPSARLGEPA